MAALVGLHLVAVGAGALPSPRGGVDASVLETDQARAQVEFVADAARRVGADADAEDIAGPLWAVGEGLRDVRRWLAGPFEPYYRYAGTTQSWRMFATVQHAPRRFTVDIDEGAGWRTVYALVDPAHRWRASTFEHERVRAVLQDFEGRPRKSYPGFARRVAAWARADFPDATAVRTRLVRRRTGVPPKPDGPAVDYQVMTFTCAGVGSGPSERSRCASVTETGPVDPT